VALENNFFLVFFSFQFAPSALLWKSVRITKQQPQLNNFFFKELEKKKRKIWIGKKRGGIFYYK
jgi:hypothetical protein